MQNRKGLIVLLLLASLLLCQIPHLANSGSIYEFWGMPFYAGGAGSSGVTTIGGRIAFRFTAQVSTNVSSLRCYSSRSGSMPAMRIGIQGVNAIMQPDGVYLTSKDFITCSFNDENLFDLPDVPLTAGTVYAIVIQWVNGTINGSNYWVNYVLSYYGSLILLANSQEIVDRQALTMYSTDNGTTWITQPWILAGTWINNVDGSNYGNPYTATSTISATEPSTQAVGENFTAPRNMTVCGLQLRAAVASGTSGDLSIRIKDSTDGIYIVDNDSFCPWAEAAYWSSYIGWITHVFNPPINITAGHVYDLIFYAYYNGSTYSTYNVMYLSSISAFNSLNWGNTTCMLKAWKNWAVVSQLAYADIPFRLILSPDPTAPAAGGGDLTEPGDLALLIVVCLICVPVGIILLAVVFRRRH